MRLIWTRPALTIRREIFERIKLENPAAARRVVTRLRDRANSLQTLPEPLFELPSVTVSGIDIPLAGALDCRSPGCGDDDGADEMASKAFHLSASNSA